ncbi:STAS domain-containing protein [Actinoplanes sp. NPDC024001]|uniref:STAS domain-containing protein n=1 Tax=Actinoplanes sp. NPDC024001 TaxID=3154598 RepID=UPI0034089113
MTVDTTPLRMAITTHQPPVIGVTITGELDASTADGLYTWIADTINQHRPARLTLDLSRLHFIDVAGVRTLYHLHTAAAAGGCTLTVTAAHTTFWWTLSRLGLEPTFAPRH